MLLQDIVTRLQSSGVEPVVDILKRLAMSVEEERKPCSLTRASIVAFDIRWYLEIKLFNSEKGFKH